MSKPDNYSRRSPKTYNAEVRDYHAKHCNYKTFIFICSLMLFTLKAGTFNDAICSWRAVFEHLKILSGDGKA